MQISIFTLFPRWFDGPLGESIIGRARETRLLDLRLFDIREFAIDRHRSVDDTPYGGGGGMILRADVLARALDESIGAPGCQGRPHVLLTSPRGRTFNQVAAMRLGRMPSLAIVCGHYEGIDERFIETRVDEEISLGEFVLTGGEIPAMAIVDALARHIPGVLGDEHGALNESFMTGFLEAGHYTRPEVFEGRAVPDVLLSGNHGAIRKWREDQAVRLTIERGLINGAATYLHPEQIRRLARRGRHFAAWLRPASPEETPVPLFATRRVGESLGWPSLIQDIRWTEGIRRDVRYAELPRITTGNLEADRKEVRADLESYVDACLTEEPLPPWTSRGFLLTALSLLREMGQPSTP